MNPFNNCPTVIGFPRSGNTFLNYCIKHVFYPNNPIKPAIHLTTAFNYYEKVIVPVRNPLDSVTSFHLFTTGYDVKDHLAFYNRFYSAALNTNYELMFLSFDKFINDITYITDSIQSHYKLELVEPHTAEFIKSIMLSENKHQNLPRNNYELKYPIKEEVLKDNLFSTSVELYQLALKKCYLKEESNV